MTRNLFTSLTAGLLLAGAAVGAETPVWKQPEYAAAIVQARAGQTAPALAMLERERARGPLAAPLLDDYLTLLCWSGRGAEALRVLPGHEADMSADTLARLARVARDQRDAAEAERLYRLLLARQPAAGYRAGLAMAQSEAGHGAAALATLDAAPAGSSADELELTRARAYVLLQSGDLTRALDYLIRARARFPGDPELERSYLGCLLRLGAPWQAGQASIADPRLALQVDFDRAATLSRWGRIQESQDSGPGRHAQTDAALKLNQDITARPEAARPPFAALAADDRVQMLQQRGLSAQAIALDRQRAGQAWSPYARAALADAYLNQRQPLRAEELYRSALRDAPQADEALDWRIGLVYALLESGQHAACRRELAALQAAAPRLKTDRASGRRVFNPAFQRVALLDAMVTAYQEDTRGGWKKMEALLDEASFNPELRQNQGSLALMRGWPRLARGVFTRLSVDEPDQPEAAATGLAGAALDLQELDEADRQLLRLNELDVDNAGVRQLRERARLERRPELVLEGKKDLSGGQGAGEQNAWESSARLYSSPFGHWRLFGLHQLQRASYVNETASARYEALGMGAEWRGEQGRGEFGLTGQIDGGRRGGAFAGYDWTPDDYWTLGARFELNSAEAPLKGRLDDVRGNRSQLSLQYRADDYRSYALQAEALSLSDGNLRRAVSANWDQRWVSGPRYKLNTILTLAASANDAVPSARYFNPRADGEASVTAMQEWKLWGEYETTWHQRLGLTLGSYTQRDFGAGGVWGLLLEQEWRWGSRGSLRYGFTRVRHPYDGKAETGNKVYLNLDWRF
ncbi:MULTISPECIES: poly-beta-1,6 N-acetyl-D-glucosamine export porin PgaA [Chromobacterium]|uniref:poly-beta-1,6 N-acetyl-D-glucosamine export porin PgaA n=1 Tax=Chromobacterium TaxID=535 RepID=UPI00188870D7|nr:MULTISPECIES: poly-beta-1,6 N-acetyl-D-glucosamine export porin PgaA [Chromobacterium]QOZ85039.1 poly-beta-1,6 N-acetyl-D-glucosamine export porin PgaA [Chromobacterium sp. Rain0013]WON85252.1 poly-beta-1,6 N-acetyl-D-glucosamine export porin PgaA [Chromobacterium haemolyticum]